MTKKNLLIASLILICNAANSQSKMAELRKQKKNSQLNAEMFSDDDPDFAVTETPKKWEDESAIILCQKFYYSYIEKGASQFEYKETSRRRIKILDDAALKYYSIYYYKTIWSCYVF